MVNLKRAHPDLLLAVEVGLRAKWFISFMLSHRRAKFTSLFPFFPLQCGYKVRFFGVDAEAASRALGIGAWPDRNFLTCWVPLPRLPFHLKRLVEAGHKVGSHGPGTSLAHTASI